MLLAPCPVAHIRSLEHIIGAIPDEDTRACEPERAMFRELDHAVSCCSCNDCRLTYSAGVDIPFNNHPCRQDTPLKANEGQRTHSFPQVQHHGSIFPPTSLSCVHKHVPQQVHLPTPTRTSSTHEPTRRRIPRSPEHAVQTVMRPELSSVIFATCFVSLVERESSPAFCCLEKTTSSKVEQAGQ